MFESLSDKLQSAFKRLRGPGKLTENDVDAALREVRLALLEADVNFRVVKQFVARVKERAIGEEILDGLNPAQQVVKIVHEEMIRLLGGESGEASLLELAGRPAVIMLCGLQGAGKTTLAGKLAAFLKKQGKLPVLAACDVQRPAAIKQLQIVGEQVKTAVFTLPNATPAQIATGAVSWARDNGADVVIVDTAGRLHIDEDLLGELRDVRAATEPSEVLLVLDAMTGQDAVNVAEQFESEIGVTGFVLTKVDGDARGGGAISIRDVVGKPIKLVGTGEKMDAIELFHPDRMASRILGMGDVLTLIEKAQEAIDEKQAADIEKRLRAGKFDFEDFLEQMQQIKRLGPLDQIMKMLPGVGGKISDAEFALGEREMKRFEAIVFSMTREERRRPEVMNGSRRKRIAAGAGTTVQEVNKVLERFEQMRSMMKGITSGKMPGQMPGLSPMAGHAARRRKGKKGKGGSGGSGGKGWNLPFGR